MDSVSDTGGGRIVKMVRQFLCCGSSSHVTMSRVYEGRVELTDAWALVEYIECGHGEKLVEEIKRFSSEQRSCNETFLVFALALCAQCNEKIVRGRALKAVKDVCKTSRCLLSFCAMYKKLRGWSKEGSDESYHAGLWTKGLRQAVESFYNDDPATASREVTQCRQACGWSHADVLRMTHVKPRNKGSSLLCKRLMRHSKCQDSGQDAGPGGGMREDMDAVECEVFDLMEAVERVRQPALATDPVTVAGLVEQQKLIYEHLPQPVTKYHQVWLPLVQNMSADSIVRHLVHIGSSKVLDQEEEEGEGECSGSSAQRLSDMVCHAIQQCSLHPIEVMWWIQKYKAGSNRHTTWTVDNNLANMWQKTIINKIKKLEAVGRSICIGVSIGKTVHFSDSKALYCMALQIFYLIHKYKNVFVIQPVKEGKIVEWKEVCTEYSFTQILENLEKTKYRGLDISDCIQWCHCSGKTVDTFVMLANHTRSRYLTGPPAGVTESIDCNNTTTSATTDAAAVNGSVINAGDSDSSGNLQTVAATTLHSLQLYRKLVTNTDVRLCVCLMDTNEDVFGDAGMKGKSPPIADIPQGKCPRICNILMGLLILGLNCYFTHHHNGFLLYSTILLYYENIATSQCLLLLTLASCYIQRSSIIFKIKLGVLHCFSCHVIRIVASALI